MIICWLGYTNGFSREAELLAIRISLGLLGIFLAVFLQAYGLPIFLLFTLLLGWWLERGKPIAFKTESGFYIVILLNMWLLFSLLMIFIEFPQTGIGKFLGVWDSISLMNLDIIQTEFENDAIIRQEVKFFINCSGLIIPFIVAHQFPKLASAFPSKDYMGRRLILAIFIFCMGWFSYWGLTNFNLYSSRVNLSLFTNYFFQTLILVVLFSNFKMGYAK